MCIKNFHLLGNTLEQRADGDAECVQSRADGLLNFRQNHKQQSNPTHHISWTEIHSIIRSILYVVEDGKLSWYICGWHGIVWHRMEWKGKQLKKSWLCKQISWELIWREDLFVWNTKKKTAKRKERQERNFN